jgi:ribonucleoside-diphosphate reductase alpha chain
MFRTRTVFKTQFSESIFNAKYRHEQAETWPELSRTLIEDVCLDFLPKDIKEELIRLHTEMKFVAGGRYLYYAGRPNKFFNNCYLLKAEEDTREDWAAVMQRGISCLMTGGGIGVDWSVYRDSEQLIKRTGGRASGPIPAMRMMNENGRNVMQGGSRRSAIYGSLNWQHGDIYKFLRAKDWHSMVIPGARFDDDTPVNIGRLKEMDFNFPAPLDMTNISVNYDDAFLREAKNGVPDVFLENVRQALKTGEPGFSFNFGDKEKETLRNACTEVTSEDDSDVCNLASLNMGNFDDIESFREAVRLVIYFLICGTLRAQLPYQKVYDIRQKNRRLGLGIMGVHEWLLKRGYRYEVTEELHKWLAVYRDESDKASAFLADNLSLSRPVANRAIAPTGSIGILAATTTGIEPLFAVAYKRRYLKGGDQWHYQYVVDGTAKALIDNYGLKPDDIETALDLARDPERRIKFQADVQDYVDMSISSTINLPAWGSPLNNGLKVEDFAKTLLKYAPRLRGFTVYPDGARGGQPLTPCPYTEAVSKEGEEYVEDFMDICEMTGGGTCGA